jgi:hypothetical protein
MSQSQQVEERKVRFEPQMRMLRVGFAGASKQGLEV